jgi:hypothetical protein
MRGRAILSPCFTYRYALMRPIENVRPACAVFLMLNPSIADADVNDPTISACMDFAKRWGADQLSVFNLYAYRATNPKELKTATDPIGPRNDPCLAVMADMFQDIVCAWGNHANNERVADVVKILQARGNNLWCLDTNKNGSPVHPLYQAREKPLKPWKPNV